MIISNDWLKGFVDGEGCFYVGINNNETMTMKKQILPEFIITQHKSDVKVLYAIKEFLKCGIVKKNNNKMSYCVRNLKHLNEIIIPFFENNELITKKKFNFIKFRWIVKSMIDKKYHLNEEGLRKIILVKKRMNKLDKI